MITLLARSILSVKVKVSADQLSFAVKSEFAEAIGTLEAVSLKILLRRIAAADMRSKCFSETTKRNLDRQFLVSRTGHGIIVRWWLLR